ncbi:MAG: IS256 family transposase, partial [Alphaproteobacteria bacterium]|nr:IS256 family transposase [Alphaproteobacteria bacterium]
MKDDNVVDFARPAGMDDPLTELLRNGAKQLIQKVVELEVEETLAVYAGQLDAQGRQAVVRNGYLPEREIMTGIGSVEVQVPKLRSRTNESAVFHSTLVPPYVRKSKSMEAALPWLYLKGISTGQM